MASFLLFLLINRALQKKQLESLRFKQQKSSLDEWVLQVQNPAHRSLIAVKIYLGQSATASVLGTDHLLFYEYYSRSLIHFASNCLPISILRKIIKQSHRTRSKDVIQGLKNTICLKIVSGNFSQIYHYGVTADKLTILSLKNIGIFSNRSEKVLLQAQFQNKNTYYTKVCYL